jgi:hypothetical protein
MGMAMMSCILAGRGVATEAPGPGTVMPAVALRHARNAAF